MFIEIEIIGYSIEYRKIREIGVVEEQKHKPIQTDVDKKRRQFLEKAAYTAPALIALGATKAVAQNPSPPDPPPFPDPE